MNCTLEEKLGQMFIVRMKGKTVTSELESLIKEYHIGGISLYYNNYDSYEEMYSLINELKKINKKYNKTPLFIAVDQEGGRVDRMPDEFKTLPSAKKISIDEKLIKESGNITGELLSDLGINLNFAPVLDIQRFSDNHAIGDRCFGENKEDVIKNGLLMMNTLKKNVIPVVKHFPGHGLVKRDSHILLPVISKDIKKEDDICPFIEAIKENVPAIMISHIMLTEMDKIYPASLSKKVIKDYLVNELGYKGLIITDDLKMKAVNFVYGYKKSALKAIEAGENVILIGSDYEEVKKCINFIKLKLNDSLIDDINTSYEKIISLKEEYNLNDDKKEKIDIEKYNKRIDKVRNSVIQ